MQEKSWHSPFLLVILALIWGYNWVVMKKVLVWVGPFTFASLRMLLGSFALFIVMYIKKQPISLRNPIQTILLGFFQTAIFTGLSMWALVAGGAGNVAVLVYTMPFWVMLLAWPLLNEKIGVIQAASITLAMIGLICFFFPSSGSDTLVSKILALSSGISWSISVILGKHMQSDGHTNVLSLTAWQMLFGGIMLTLVLPFVHESPIHTSPYFWFALAYNVGPSTALGWLTWLYLLRKMKAGTASLGILLAPVFGVLSAALELNEIPNSINLTGIFAILGALTIISAYNMKHLTAILQE